MTEYGPSLKKSTINMEPLHKEQIRGTIEHMSNSASGLDNTSIHEIKIATRWCPELLTALVSLLQCIENAEKWPRNLTKGVVAFIPKDTENEQPKPEEFRPITILSTIYIYISHLGGS